MSMLGPLPRCLSQQGLWHHMLRGLGLGFFDLKLEKLFWSVLLSEKVFICVFFMFFHFFPVIFHIFSYSLRGNSHPFCCSPPKLFGDIYIYIYMCIYIYIWNPCKSQVSPCFRSPFLHRSLDPPWDRPTRRRQASADRGRPQWIRTPVAPGVGARTLRKSMVGLR